MYVTNDNTKIFTPRRKVVLAGFILKVLKIGATQPCLANGQFFKELYCLGGPCGNSNYKKNIRNLKYIKR